MEQGRESLKRASEHLFLAIHHMMEAVRARHSVKPMSSHLKAPPSDLASALEQLANLIPEFDESNSVKIDDVRKLVMSKLEEQFDAVSALNALDIEANNDDLTQLRELMKGTTAILCNLKKP